MVLKAKDHKIIERKKMRDGDGSVFIKTLADVSHIDNCRLFVEIEIPVGCGIGEHEHINETEFYLITAGEGTVCDDSVDKNVGVGDVIITGNGATHNIRNSGDVSLVLLAVIVTTEGK